MGTVTIPISESYCPDPAKWHTSISVRIVSPMNNILKITGLNEKEVSRTLTFKCSKICMAILQKPMPEHAISETWTHLSYCFHLSFLCGTWFSSPFMQEDRSKKEGHVLTLFKKYLEQTYSYYKKIGYALCCTTSPCTLFALSIVLCTSYSPTPVLSLPPWGWSRRPWKKIHI